MADIEQRAHIAELTELRRLVPSVCQREALDAAIAALASQAQVPSQVYECSRCGNGMEVDYLAKPSIVRNLSGKEILARYLSVPACDMDLDHEISLRAAIGAINLALVVPAKECPVCEHCGRSSDVSAEAALAAGWQQGWDGWECPTHQAQEGGSDG